MRPAVRLVIPVVVPRAVVLWGLIRLVLAMLPLAGGAPFGSMPPPPIGVVVLAGVVGLIDVRVRGELRRAEIALAMTRMPTVLIADEPYRGVTPADHDDLTGLFRTLAADGCAVVVTGHDVPSLLAAADHVTWCTDGTTYELGTPEQACEHDAFRRGYLGARVHGPSGTRRKPAT